jgi:TPR repeat protein
MNNIELVDEAYEAKMIAFEIGCADGAGDAMGCHNVGEFLSVVKDDHARAAAVYTKNCADRKFSPSCFNLAKLYFAGRGVARDDDQAMALFDKACSGGHLAACYHFGALLYLEESASKQVERVVMYLYYICLS